jgi:hypothetical protein
MKLVKPDQFNRPPQYVIRLPYAAAQVKAGVTVLVLENNQVELYGQVSDETVGKAILEAGLERLAQFHDAQRSAILGMDGQPLPKANTPEGAA